MDFECILNLTEICRCCKRTEPGMTSIFDGNAHPTDHTYPPVKEMLSSITSLNVQENDGLPSLVCTSCLNNIQDAFTFILQVIQINEELSQMLATGKQDNTALSQSTYESNQYISTDYLKKENEDVNHSLKVEDLDEPMLNFYQHGSDVSSYENIDLVVKLEQLDQDAAGNVDEPEAAEENEVSNLADPLYHASDEEKDISLVKEYTCTGNENLSVNDDDNLLMVQKSDEMEDFEDMDDLGADEDYHVELEDGNSVDDATAEGIADRDTDEEIKETSKLSMFKCNLCTYTNAQLYILKRHLVTHSNDKPSFTCSKCNLPFKRKDGMRRHWRKCNGEISTYSVTALNRRNRSGPKPVVALTLKDLGDELKVKEYYTEIEVQNNDEAKIQRAKNVEDGVENEETSKLASKRTVFKCNLCAFTNGNGYLSNLRRHLQTHATNRPYPCSNCNASFPRKDYLQRHLKICNAGYLEQWKQNRSLVRVRNRHRGYTSRHVITLTLKDLEDSNKIMTYFTETDVQNSDDGDDDVNVQRAVDRTKKD